jgi:hypothetical protein
MRKPALFLIAAALLGPTACTNSAVQQSGGSGFEDWSGGIDTTHDISKGCRPDDTNCIEFYKSPGGG